MSIIMTKQLFKDLCDNKSVGEIFRSLPLLICEFVGRFITF